MPKPRVICTVTNDLNYDQRMIRICNSLQEAGYNVLLVGIERKKSAALQKKAFEQKRIPVWFEKGKLFYLEYNIRLLFYLLSAKVDVLCAIDLDTIMPVYYASILRKKKRVYDAHELFTEMQEVMSRPLIYKMWSWVEKTYVKRFSAGYTVGAAIADIFRERYGVHYGLVRNITVLKPFEIPEKKEHYILYQGAVNVGRCFEYLIPAMKQVDATLIICGEGNFFEQAKQITAEEGLNDKVIFKGYVPPDELRNFTLHAYIGITLFEATATSNKYSLANRFFDYMHHGVPQLCVKYPEYEKINADYEVAHLIEKPTTEYIARGLNYLLENKDYYKRLLQNCLLAREQYCWQHEEKTLLKIYDQLG
ncbi:MAG TPA: glycosyltransferase [Flavipsychrobacter sp.]|nr:glycosyltransferase [Flavipsychrobacter sp.]